MRVYISGPISGHPRQNERMFRLAADYVERNGHEPLVPLDITPRPHEGDCPPSYADGNGHTAACHIRADLVLMLDYCDSLLMLPGWEASVGARLEHSVAAHCGMPISYFEYPMGGVVDPSALRIVGEAVANG